jgi:hypothetical protein
MGISATRVWAVRLDRADEEYEGTLSLAERELVFESGEGTLRIPLVEVRRVKRVLGSPILMVERAEESGPARIAFYFSKPPPLADAGKSRRRARRQATTYLSLANREKKDRVKEWVSAIDRALAGPGARNS